MSKKKNRYAPATVNIAERALRFIPSGRSLRKLVTFSKGGQIVAVPASQVVSELSRISKKKITKNAKNPVVMQPTLASLPALKKAAPNRPSTPKNEAEKKPSKAKDKLLQTSSKEFKKRNSPKHGPKESGKRTILPYDGPQRFAGSFRISQGGLYRQ